MNDFTADDLHIGGYAVFITDNAGENDIINVTIAEADGQEAAAALVESILDPGWMVAMVIDMVDNITITG